MFKPADIVATLFILMYAAASTIIPISFVTIASEFNLSLTEGGGIEGIRTILIFLTLFLSGFVSAKLGKISSLTIAGVCYVVGFGFFSLVQNYTQLLGATLIIGFGSGIIEGLVNPLVQDAHPLNSGKYLNITNAFWCMGVLTVNLLCGQLLTMGVSWRYFMIFLSFLSIVSSLVAFIVQVGKSVPVIITPIKMITREYKACFTSTHFWLFFVIMIFAGGVEGAFTYWSASYIQVHFAGSARMGGLGTACFALGMMSVRFLGGILIKQKYLRRFVISSAIAGFFMSFSVPFVQTQQSFLLVLFLNGLCIACFWPSLQSYAVERMSFDPTIIFILLSCAGVPGFGLTSFVMGLVADIHGFDKSFFIVPAMFIFLLGSVLLERHLFANKKIKIF
ncbi:MAG: MFS transporter [Bacteroidales bacterium]